MKVISKYMYGSHVYGTATENSDKDFIRVVECDNIGEIPTFQDGCDYTNYTPKGFQEAINRHEISVLECIFQPENQVEGKTDWEFNLNKQILRNSISSISSNSYVKAKKKLIDNEIYIAQKSLFHSIRIIMFGIQIAAQGTIYDYSCANKDWEKIKILEPDWNIWRNNFHEYRNGLMSVFRQQAPKL